MDNEQILERANHLDGISYSDWQKIKFAVDESFKRKRRELDNQIKLSCDQDLPAVIRSLFG